MGLGSKLKGALGGALGGGGLGGFLGGAGGGLGGIWDGITGGFKGAEEGYGQGIDQLGKMFNLSRKDLAPYRTFGANALNDLNFSPDQIANSQAYKFRLGEGQNTLENSAAARGGLLSGNALRDLTDYGQNFASNEYQNEFLRRMAKVGIGLNAAGGSAGLASKFGDSIAALYGKQGEAKTDRYGNVLNLGGNIFGSMLGLG